MPGALRFDYHRSVAPMMWVLVALSGIELLVVHFLLALWRPWVALVVSGLTLSGIVWLAGAVASFRRLPVLIEDQALVMRAGRLRAFRIPLGAVAGFREQWTAAELKARDVSNLALIAYPNIWVDLAEPVAGRRGPIRAVAHRLDDPAAFRTALETARGELVQG
jgi:hypothetical protein